MAELAMLGILVRILKRCCTEDILDGFTANKNPNALRGCSIREAGADFC
jgi:hypothetical protein